MRVVEPLETYLHLFPLRGRLALLGPGEGAPRGGEAVALSRVPGERPLPLEEFLVVLLKLDPRWARACAARNRRSIRRGRLARRLREEGLERRASEWRFDDFGLKLPPARKVPRSHLVWHEMNNMPAERRVV